jgi:hypothetical protein
MTDANMLIRGAEPGKITAQDLFFEIFVAPRKVFRYIDEKNYSKYLLPLMAIAGVERSFAVAMNLNFGDYFLPFGIVIICTVMGIIFGAFGYFGIAYLVEFFGKYLGGAAPRHKIMNILIYASVGALMALPLYFVEYLYFGMTQYKFSWVPVQTILDPLVAYYVISALRVIIGAWTVALMTFGISELRGISFWKAFLNVIIPLAAVLAAFWFLIKTGMDYLVR